MDTMVLFWVLDLGKKEMQTTVSFRVWGLGWQAWQAVTLDAPPHGNRALFGECNLK